MIRTNIMVLCFGRPSLVQNVSIFINLRPTSCLQPTPTPFLIIRKNIRIQVWFWFYIVGTVFNTGTTQHIKIREITFVFPYFIMTAIAHVKRDIRSGREIVWKQGEYPGLTANFNAPFCFDRMECLDCFGPGGLVDHCWREFFK